MEGWTDWIAKGNGDKGGRLLLFAHSLNRIATSFAPISFLFTLLEDGGGRWSTDWVPRNAMVGILGKFEILGRHEEVLVKVFTRTPREKALLVYLVA